MIPDGRLQNACEAIKDHVDSQKMAGKIATTTMDGVEIGYRVKEFNTFLRREIFIKTPGEAIDKICKEDQERVLTAVFNVFLVPGAGMPEIQQIAFDCILLKQDVIPMVQVERNPRVRSLVGGLG